MEKKEEINQTPEATLDMKDYVICPYDKLHVIIKTRLPRHLVRCRHQHPEKDLKTCPFNSTHLLEEEKFSEHVQVCPERSLFEQFRHKDVLPGRRPAFLDAPEFEPVPSFESWDEGPDCPSYDIEKAIKDRPILRLIKGGTRKERRELRIKENARLAKILEEKRKKEAGCANEKQNVELKKAESSGSSDYGDIFGV